MNQAQRRSATPSYYNDDSQSSLSLAWRYKPSTSVLGNVKINLREAREAGGRVGDPLTLSPASRALTILQRIPSAKALGYYHPVRFADEEEQLLS